MSKKHDLEMPTERAERLISEIANADISQYGKDKVQAILRCVTQAGTVYNGLFEVESLARGDVFIARVTGGKVRPWVVLSCREGIAVAVAMSSGDYAPRMVKSKARYWLGTWIGTTVSLFKESDVKAFCARPYNNRDHLREVEAQLASLMALRPLAKGAW